MLQQLCDLSAFPDLIRCFAQILDQYDNLAPISGVNYPSVTHQTLAGRAGTSLHDAASRWHELNRNSSTDARPTTSSNREILAGVEVVADIFSQVGNSR